MSRFGLGHTVNKTIHKYPVTRIARVHGVAKKVHRYPIGRYGSRNAYLDVFESIIATGDLNLDSVTVSIAAFSEGDVTPFTITLQITHEGVGGTNDIVFDPTYGADVVFALNDGGATDRGPGGTGEYAIASDPGNATQISPGQTINLVYNVTPAAAVTNDTITAVPTVTAADETTTDPVIVTGAPTDSYVANNDAEVTVPAASLVSVGGPFTLVDDLDTNMQFSVDLENLTAAPASGFTPVTLNFHTQTNPGAVDSSDQFITTVQDTYVNQAQGAAATTYTLTVQAQGATVGAIAAGDYDIRISALTEPGLASASVINDTVAGTAIDNAQFTDNMGLLLGQISVVNHAQVDINVVSPLTSIILPAGAGGADVYTLTIQNTAAAPGEGLDVTFASATGLANLFNYVDNGGAGADVASQFTTAWSGAPAFTDVAADTVAAAASTGYTFLITCDNAAGITWPVEMTLDLSQLNLVGSISGTLSDPIVNNFGSASLTDV